MKVLQIVDSHGWAIDRLSQLIVKYNPQIIFKTVYVHPREVEAGVDEVRSLMDWADIIDFQYWRTAEQLLEFIPELRNKKTILSHHNQKNLLSANWDGINAHVAHTQYSSNTLVAEGGYQNVHLIPYGIDLDYFTYNNDNYPPDVPTVGYCGRIVPWKGLAEIARACYELGYRLLFMGKPDKRDYWESIPESYKQIIDFGYMDVPAEERINFYRELTVYVGNSNDGREEGTQPLLEAMACGVPVLTTPSGMAADIIEDRVNGWITPFGDYEALKSNLQKLMEDNTSRLELRKKAWNTIKTYTEERMAWDFAKVYHSVYSDLPLVSVIIPTYNNSENVLKILNRLEESLQFYNHIEVVISDDGSDDVMWLKNLDLTKYSFPIKVVATMYASSLIDSLDKQYGLAQARNKAVIQAAGEYLMFCDSRMCPDAKAISIFMQKMQEHKKDKVWLFGEKGGNKDSFVENFSMIRRDYFIRAGMMNERIDHYGGMSQELRTRFKWQGFEPIYVPEARATQISGSHLNAKRRADIIKSKLMLWKMGMKG